MKTNPNFDKAIKPKPDLAINKENKLQKILRSKESIQMTAKEHESYRLSDYEAVR